METEKSIEFYYKKENGFLISTLKAKIPIEAIGQSWITLKIRFENSSIFFKYFEKRLHKKRVQINACFHYNETDKNMEWFTFKAEIIYFLELTFSLVLKIHCHL